MIGDTIAAILKRAGFETCNECAKRKNAINRTEQKVKDIVKFTIVKKPLKK